MDKKVTIVGAGNVGTTTAKRIIERCLAHVVLIDVVDGMPQGKALDLMQATPVGGCTTRVMGTNDYKDTKDSDIVVVTAGLPRKPGMSRDDLLKKNADITRSVIGQIMEYNKDPIIITVTNPLDVMTQLAYEISGLPSGRVLGMAGVLDSSRYRFFIAEALGTSAREVHAMVLGGHGDSMVPLPRYSTVSGIPITQLLSNEQINAINERTRKGGAEIVGLLKSGSAYYAPSASVTEMVQSILLNENKILPCSVYLNGEYELRDVYCGVPVKLSAKGLQDIIELDLTPDEMAELHRSANAVVANVAKLK